MTAKPAVLFWSGGKDSALALDRVRRAAEHRVEALITTINPEFGRVSMHGVREGLVEAQAQAAGLPLERMYVGSSTGNDAYVAALRDVLATHRARGVEAAIFGDIFLADLRAWREGFLTECGMQGVFPLWGEDTTRLSQDFVARGFRAVTCCIDDAHLDETAVGRELDAGFFGGLPPAVDPCGENGEYHSFVYDGPVFSRPVAFKAGERVYRPLGLAPAAEDPDRPAIPVPSALPQSATKGFWFVDLLPAD